MIQTPHVIQNSNNMGSRKRNRDEMESSEPAPELSMLDRLRNTWELANLMQYIYIFGKAVKIDEDLMIEVLLPKTVVLSSVKSGSSIVCLRHPKLNGFLI